MPHQFVQNKFVQEFVAIYYFLTNDYKYLFNFMELLLAIGFT